MIGDSGAVDAVHAAHATARFARRADAPVMHWTAIVSPVAGRVRTSRLRGELVEALSRRGVRVEAPDGWTGPVGRLGWRSSAVTGSSCVVWDGTLSAVAGTAAECDGTIAVVPTGAGNDFARNLGIGAQHPLDALELLERGRVAACDLGRATTGDGTVSWFTTVANTGFDSEANRWVTGVRGATGTPLYVLAVLRTLATYRPQPLRVTVDGTTLEGRTWLAAVGNTRFYAGGMLIVPAAEVDDGLLDVCVIGDVARWEFLARFPRVFRGTHPAVAGVRTRRGGVVEVETAGSAVPRELWAAGERVGPLPARVEAVAGAVRVLVPDGAPVTGR